MIYKGQIPYKRQDSFLICECQRCGEPLTATMRDARELSCIFDYYIKKENLWITKIKKTIITGLGGQY